MIKLNFDVKITQPTLMHNDRILNFDYKEHDIDVARKKSRYHQESRLKGHTVEFAASWDYSENGVRDFRLFQFPCSASRQWILL